MGPSLAKPPLGLSWSRLLILLHSTKNHTPETSPAQDDETKGSALPEHRTGESFCKQKETCLLSQGQRTRVLFAAAVFT